MGDVNYFGTRDHYMFITYKDMIKLTYPVLLMDLVKNYYDDLKDYLDLDSIKDYDIFNMERLCVERLNINPLTYIKKPECDEKTCDLLLQAFNEESIDIYTKSRLSEFGSKLSMIFPQERIRDFYIYVEEPNHQVIIDCETYFGDFKNKIKFLTGDFIEAVKAVPVKPTCYVLNDINYVHRLIETGFIKYTEVILGELGCNYELDKDYQMKLKGLDDKVLKDNIFKIVVTPIVNLDKRHFSMLDIPED